MENSLLSEIGGSKGARESSGDVGSKRLRIQLDSSNDYFLYLLCILFILCLNTIDTLTWDGKQCGSEDCDGLVLLESPKQKL